MKKTRGKYAKRKTGSYSPQEEALILSLALQHGLDKSARKIVNAQLKANDLPIRGDGALYAKMKSLISKADTIKPNPDGLPKSFVGEIKVQGKLELVDGQPFLVFKLS